jgi:hypothetical protein
MPVMLDPERNRFRARVPAGAYTLRATADSEDGQALVASVNLTVRSDLDDVGLVLGPAVTLPIRVQFETTNTTAPDRKQSNQVVIHLIPSSPYGNEAWASVGRQTGASEVKNLDLGRYSVDISNPGGRESSGRYVASAACGGVDLLRADLEIAAGRSCTIDIVMRDDGGSLTGKVVSGPQAAPVSVILVPDNAPRAAKMVSSAQDGSFQFNDLAPGSYTVLAIDRADQLEYSDPEVMADYLPAGSHVTVQANSEANVTTNLVLTAK